MSQVGHLHGPDDLRLEIVDFAERLAGHPSLAMRSIENMIDLSGDVSKAVGIRIANREWARLHGTEDYEEELASFVEDREPEWKGRGNSWKG